MEEDRIVLKLCSILLDYPNKQWTNTEELKDALNLITNPSIKGELSSFYQYLENTTDEDLCETYVRQFDFNDQTTLFLTYGIFGENQERGQALVKLKMEYAKAGFYLKEEELPDYLPLILEFASEADRDFAKKSYLIHKKAIDRLYEKLKEEKSPYAHLIKSCLYIFDNLLRTSMDHINKGNVG